MRLPSRSARLSVSAFAAAALLLLAVSVARATPSNPKLRAIHAWAFAIGDGDESGNLVARYAHYDLVVLDGEGASAEQVHALQRAGKLVLGYLDVGTIEPYRSWYPLLKPYRLDYWPDWGEWYADVSAAGFRSAIVGRIAPQLLRKGFDGLFLDNTDMIETHPRQAGGMRTLVAALAQLVHGRGGLLFGQNGIDSIGPTLRYYDGWNEEDVTSTYDFSRKRYVLQPPGQISADLGALRRFAARGLLVLATDYVAARDASDTRTAIANACSAGALPFVSDIDLTRIPRVPARCGPG